MSITYELDLGGATTPKAVLTTIVEVGAGIVTENDATGGSMRGGGWFSVDAAEYDPPDPVENEFGFAPTVEVVFGLSKAGDFDSQETDVLRLVLGVLNRIPGDALLHYQYSEVWLHRSGGRLTVNDGLWKPQRLTLLPQPYESRTMAFS
jgi:hypothetical protein